MTSAPARALPTSTRTLRRASARLRRYGVTTSGATTVSLMGLTVLTTAAIAVNDTQDEAVPFALFILVELLGGFVLRFRPMVVLCGAIAAELVYLGLADVKGLGPGALIVQVLAAVSVLLFVRNRDRLGLQGAATDLMLVDLRDRLEAHGSIPELPPRWRVESAVRAAHAEAFSGDFVVAARSGNGSTLEIALVDVSGKGQDAGVRSLLLSGAFGGLLGALPPREFLGAANTYLLRQSWGEGFATAVHLTVDLDIGDFVLAYAGHPPAVQLHSGSGQFEVLDGEHGPVLGVLPDAVFPGLPHRLERGDSLLLYTDGVVEVPGQDVDLGLDRLLGIAERLVATRRGGADAVLAAVRAAENDDRALVLVRRD